MPRRTPAAPSPTTASSSSLHSSTPARTTSSVDALLQRIQAQSVQSLTPQEVQLLQRTVGNRVVQRMFAGSEPVLQFGRGRQPAKKPVKKVPPKSNTNVVPEEEKKDVSMEQSIDSESGETSSVDSSTESKGTESLDISAEEKSQEDGNSSKKTKKEKKPPTPIKAKTKGAKRLRRSASRNERRKSIPKAGNTKHLQEHLAYYNYQDLGEKIEMDVKDNTGKFHLFGGMSNGTGGQPNFTTRQEDFPGGTVESDYDSLIKSLATVTDYTEAQIAQMALNFIQLGTPIPLTGEPFHAMNVLIQLTQLVEPHKTRLPGTDKWARGSLRHITDGSSFKQEFNRTDGSFLPARARGDRYTGKLSGQGGQQWGRAAFGIPTPNDHHFKEGDIFTTKVKATLNHLSDSSAEDSDEESPVRPAFRRLEDLPAKTTKNQPRKKKPKEQKKDIAWDKTSVGKQALKEMGYEGEYENQDEPLSSRPTPPRRQGPPRAARTKKIETQQDDLSSSSEEPKDNKRKRDSSSTEERNSKRRKQSSKVVDEQDTSPDESKKKRKKKKREIF